MLIHRQDLNLTLGSLGSNSMALAQVIQRLKLYIAVVREPALCGLGKGSSPLWVGEGSQPFVGWGREPALCGLGRGEGQIGQGKWVVFVAHMHTRLFVLRTLKGFTLVGQSRHVVCGQVIEMQVFFSFSFYICVLQIQCDLYGRMLYDGTLSLLVLPVVNVTSRVMVS